jgi:hypothetical protein
MKQILLSILLILSFGGQSQEDSLTQDTGIIDLRTISATLFGCECYKAPDNYDFEFPRPVENDDLMIQAFRDYLNQRYGLDTTDFGIWVLDWTVQEGEQISDIWVELAFKDNKDAEEEDGTQDLVYILPLCSFEELYRSSGSNSVVEEIRHLFEWSVEYERTLSN